VLGFSTIRQSQRPRLFTRLCAGSVVMLVLLLFLWVNGTLFCSAFVLQHWSYRGKSFERFERLYVGAGIILVDFERSDFVRDGWTQAEIDDYYTGVTPGWHFRHFRWDSQYRLWGWDFPRFTRYRAGSRISISPYGDFHLVIPLWLLIPPCGVMPMVRWRFRCRQRTRGRHGLCVACGYDLRATAEAGGALLPICPECGIERAHPSRAREQINLQTTFAQTDNEAEGTARTVRSLVHERQSIGDFL
jgi:hypothetical protein